MRALPQALDFARAGRDPLVLLSARLLDPVTGELLPDTALAVSGGRIAALGDDRQIRSLADSSTTVIDLKGAVVTPGLVDGHLHPVSGAELTQGLDLSGCAGLEEVREALAREVRTLAPGAWLHGWGLDPNVFGDRPIEAAALAPVLDGVPALLQLFDAHSMLASPRAMDANGDSLALYTDLDAAGELPLRLRVAPWCQPGTDADALRALIEEQGTGGGLWRTEGVKLFMDGTIDNGTAWLERPDCHGESTHAFWPDPDAYTRIVGELHRAGVPTATHAIGDAAVRHVLDSVDKALAAGDRVVRHRIEHIETVPDDTLRRFAELGVVASMQPTHCCDFTRADHTDNWSRRLGEERASRAWRCRDLWDSGATVVLGSDWPIAPYPPLAVMAGARHRRPSRDLTQPPHGPDQALTALEALQAMTINPAYAAGEEHEAGRLAVGHRADLTAFAENPLTTPAADLPELPVVLTVLDGRLTHRSPSL
ncbi:amidohydrolase [Streptomyces sp. NPDC059460]|uniref:amidohydrolase n=1 Tax=Streptomyces sp. NPDC059460 TaxID=3346840 RepID=UPI003674C630